MGIGVEGTKPKEKGKKEMKMTACHPLARFIYELVCEHMPVTKINVAVGRVMRMFDLNEREENVDEHILLYAEGIARLLMTEKTHVCSECDDEGGEIKCDTREVAKVRINPGACVKCPFFNLGENGPNNSCNLDTGPDNICSPKSISPLCPLRKRDVMVFLREDQRTE